ncbi:lecithin retinol acyltransferase family protein [Helicobacter felis]|uniref:lecithin retinol acyltransferase family protein n=1 Tax=Helicobacter felis TaxID=214 RepID=UPI001F36E8AC|nr:lecithin retinol acyltransferase family protein [Helicobacter felis]
MFGFLKAMVSPAGIVATVVKSDKEKREKEAREKELLEAKAKARLIQSAIRSPQATLNATALYLLHEIGKRFYESFMVKYPIHRKSDIWDDAPVDGEPAVGSIVWCDLGDAAHSGIYLGKRKIMHLTGKFNDNPCKIEKTDLYGFSGGDHIFVSCKDKMAVGDPKAAEYAKEHENEERDYNLLENNCHGFTAECFTGNEQNEVRISKPDDVGENLGMDRWRWWKYQ